MIEPPQDEKIPPELVEKSSQIINGIIDEHTCPKCGTWWIPCDNCGKKLNKGDNFKPFFEDDDGDIAMAIFCEDCSSLEEKEIEEEKDNGEISDESESA